MIDYTIEIDIRQEITNLDYLRSLCREFQLNFVVEYIGSCVNFTISGDIKKIDFVVKMYYNYINRLKLIRQCYNMECKN